MAKKGGGFIETMFAAGVGAYAAKKSGSMSGLLMKLAYYTLVIFAVLVVIYVVARMMGTEFFQGEMPAWAVPSKEGDEKTVTPAGNVILH
jgi:hypothetical protein